jgi:hypothetical protein
VKKHVRIVSLGEFSGKIGNFFEFLSEIGHFLRKTGVFFVRKSQKQGVLAGKKAHFWEKVDSLAGF